MENFEKLGKINTRNLNEWAIGTNSMISEFIIFANQYLCVNSFGN